MPILTLSLPLALGLFTLFLSVGAGLVFFALQQTGRVVDPTATPTVTLTMTPTITPTPVTPTATFTPEPSPTPETYQVQPNDTCISIAAAFEVSVQSIVLLNNLPADCGSLSIGQQLLIPQPTPTPTPLPTATLSEADATEQACEKADYLVLENDTLGSIAQAYNVPMAVIKEYNGLSSDAVFVGSTLTIPLCKQNPTPGPTPTATPPPPYPAPNPLLPPDGQAFTLDEDTISLQWATVGTLREDEAYEVTIVDITAGAIEGEEHRQVEYVTDTKLIVPAILRPTNNIPHAFRWSVRAVRQTGSDEDGRPVWEAAGAASNSRVFVWSAGAGGPAGVTPTP
jgi:LysM repeat protein